MLERLVGCVHEPRHSCALIRAPCGAVTCWAGPGEMGGFQIKGAPALLENGARDSFSRDNEPMD